MREQLLVAALLAAAAGPAPALAEVTVSVGARLQAKAAVYGAREFPGLEKDLQAAVAARAAKGGFTRVELVLEDVVPNRPTPAMLARTVNLDFRSRSRGGAEVSGTAYGPGGARPVRFSWWAYDLAESGAGIWTDSERAFQLLASELAHGRTPDRAGGGDAPKTWPRDGSRISDPGLQH